MRHKLFLSIFAVVFLVFADEPIKMVVELRADSVKTMGQAKGLLSDLEILKENAIFAAKGDADVLLKPDFFYEEKDDSLFVTVTGFAARYVNLRLRTQEYNNISTFNVELPSEKNESGKGFYFSIKATTLTGALMEFTPNIGLNISFGGFTKYFLIGGDFGFGFGDDYFIDAYNYAFFGYRAQPSEWIQIIPGISLGLGLSDYYIAMGGVSTKFLFGKNKTWFEFTHRFLVFGYSDVFPHQVMFGFTYAPSKK
jgi:hypothetical protein